MLGGNENHLRAMGGYISERRQERECLGKPTRKLGDARYASEEIHSLRGPDRNACPSQGSKASMSKEEKVGRGGGKKLGEGGQKGGVLLIEVEGIAIHQQRREEANYAYPFRTAQRVRR